MTKLFYHNFRGLSRDLLFIYQICFYSRLIVFDIALLAKKIGNIQVLNNVAIFFTLGIYLPKVLLIFAIKICDYKSLFIIISAASFLLGLFIGIFYTLNKIKSPVAKENLNKKKLTENKIILFLILLSGFMIFRIIINNISGADIGLFIAVLAWLLICCCVPFLIVSTVQLFILIKYKSQLV